MSWNIKKSNTQNKSTPLVEEEKHQQVFNALQNKFMEMLRIYDQMMDYSNRLENLSRKDYERIKTSVHKSIQVLPAMISDINCMSMDLRAASLKDKELKQRIAQQLQIIDQKLKPKQDELPRIINLIVEREKVLTRKISLSYRGSAQLVSNSFNSNDGNSLREDGIRS